MYLIDYDIRPLTIENSNTNLANYIWFNCLTPIERYELPRKIKCDLFPLERSLRGCLNYIEDHIKDFNPNPNPNPKEKT